MSSRSYTYALIISSTLIRDFCEWKKKDEKLDTKKKQKKKLNNENNLLASL